jgi:methionyl-tRNA formyltransferase
MTKTSPKIVFFGTENYSLITLKALVDEGFNVVCVVTKPDTKRGRGHRLTEPPVKTFAKSHNIPVLQPNKVNEITDHIKQLQPVTGVLVAYGKIIPQSIIDLFTPGIINVHPSILPKYRGPSPIESAIANRDYETGVSIMQLDKKMDAGPIYSQITQPLTGKEAKFELYDKLFHDGTSLLIKNLPNIINGSLQPTPQDDNNATYCQLLAKENSWINSECMTAAEAEAHVRAHLGFPRSRMTIDNRDIIITKSHCDKTPSSHLDKKFADGNYLIIDELIAPSGKTMTAEDYLRGYK